MKTITLPNSLFKKVFRLTDPYSLTASYLPAVYLATEQMREFMVESGEPHTFVDGRTTRKGLPLPVTLTASPHQLTLFCIRFGIT